MPLKFRRRPSRKARRPLSKSQTSAVTTLVKKQVKKMSEWKHLTTLSGVAVDTTGTVVDLSAVPQGDTDVSRDGDQLMASSISFRYHVTVADSYNITRVILFQWYPQTNPGVSDVLNVAAGLEVLSPYETDKASQFKILYDRSHTTNQPYSGGAFSTQVVSKKIRIPRSKMQFVAASTTGSNKIYALYISDSAVATHPQMSSVYKLNFRDA